MNTEKKEEGFCQSSLKPWLWVLAVLICLTVIWIIWGGQHNAARRGRRDRPEIDAPWARSTAGTATANTNARAELVLAPLPLGAARTMTPPHGDRGRCNNCHPVAGASTAGNAIGQQALGAQPGLTPLPLGAARTMTPPHGDRGRCHNCHPAAGSSTAGSGMWQQARGTKPGESVLSVQEAFADAAAQTKHSVVNIVVARGAVGNANLPGMQFANPSGELVNGGWCPLPYSRYRQAGSCSYQPAPDQTDRSRP